MRLTVTIRAKSDQIFDLILFYEYFHGNNGAGLGASHQTGWTGLVARLIQITAQGMFEFVDKPHEIERPAIAMRASGS
jgi:hypothetical protein